MDRQAYRDLAAQAPFDGMVEIEVDTGLGVRRGSGVIVAEGWVLSAAHVTWGAPAADVRVRHSGHARTARDVRYAAGWSDAPATGLSQGNDLVLIRVGGTPEGHVAILARDSGIGAIGFLGGFGRGGNGILGASGPAERLVGMNVIDRRVSAPGGGGFLVTDFDDGGVARNALAADTVRRTFYDAGFEGPKLTSTVLDSGTGMSRAAWSDLPTAARYFPALPDAFLEGTSAPGDSGGPLFVADETTGEWLLAGVSSWGVNPLLPEGFARTDSRYGDLAFFTDLGAHRGWIAATVPEPAAPILWMLAIALAASRRTPRHRGLGGALSDSPGKPARLPGLPKPGATSPPPLKSQLPGGWFL